MSTRHCLELRPYFKDNNVYLEPACLWLLMTKIRHFIFDASFISILIILFIFRMGKNEQEPHHFLAWIMSLKKLHARSGHSKMSTLELLSWKVDELSENGALKSNLQLCAESAHLRNVPNSLCPWNLERKLIKQLFNMVLSTVTVLIYQLV